MVGEGKSSSSADRIFDAVCFFLCTAAVLIFVFPLYTLVISSISDPYAVWNGEVVWRPVNITFRGYEEVLRNSAIWTGFLNSVVYTAVGVAISLFLTTTMAYALSRREFLPRGVLMKFMAFTMYFSGGLIPTYLWMQQLHLVYTVVPVIMLGSVSVINVIIVRTFIQSNIPDDLREAAMLDGCGDIRYFLSVVIPLSRAVLAVMVLYYGVAYWNAYFNAMIYLNNESQMPLQVVLRQILFNTQLDTTVSASQMFDRLIMQELVKYCAIIIASIPPLVAYPFVQKNFNKGVMMGSLKG